MAKMIVTTVIAAISLVVAGSAAAEAEFVHVGDPNTDNVGFFLPGGDHKTTFAVFVPSQVRDSAGPNN